MGEDNMDALPGFMEKRSEWADQRINGLLSVLPIMNQGLFIQWVYPFIRESLYELFVALNKKYPYNFRFPNPETYLRPHGKRGCIEWYPAYRISAPG